uniref:DnaJ homolog subfamily C member 10 n=1 Tax=Clastoptera arizonana TaxID=38151 RepID=A0A1B6D3Y5_9HEMI
MFLIKLLLLLLIGLTYGEDYYKLLGINKAADNREIRRAFKKIAVVQHPDKNQDDPEAHAKFVKLTRAYEVLKDPESRKHYDMFGVEKETSSWSNSKYHSYSYYRDHFGIYDDDPQIITLNSADFESNVLKSDSQWFVNYYSPSCSHCHDLAPTWRKLATELEGAIMFGAVNCEEDWNLCRQQNIRSYPSLVFYPTNERFNGDRNRENLLEFILNRLKTDIRFVNSNDDWEKLTVKNEYISWLLLLCNGESQTECLSVQERTILAAMLNNLVGMAVIDCQAVAMCKDFLDGEYSTAVYWEKAQHSNSYAARVLNNKQPLEMAKEVLDYIPGLKQLDTGSFKDILNQLEMGSQTAWLVYFHLGAAAELDVEVKKLPAMLQQLNVGRVNCGHHATICSDLSVSRYPSFAVLKPGGGYEFYHGTVSAHSVAQFAKESATAINLRTLSQHLFPQLVTESQDGNTVWFIDFYSPWCPPCLRFLPELRKASRTVDSVRFGTVDCTIHSQLCKEHNIQSYPTTMLFNRSEQAQRFQGEHSAHSVIDFIQDLLNPTVIKLNEETFYTKVGMKSPDSIWVVDFFMPWCGPCQALAPQWRKFAKLVSDQENVHIAEVNCQEETKLCSQQGVRSYPTIRLYPLRSHGLNTVALYSGYHRDAKSFRQWLFSFLPSRVVELTPDTFTQVLQGNEYWLVDFYAPWCGHCNVFDPEFRTVAQKLEKKVKAGKVNCDSYRSLCQRTGVTQYPTVQFYSPGSNNYKGLEITSQSADRIISFVEQKLANHYTRIHDEF